MHYLAVLREYRGKAHLRTQRPRYAVDLSAHVLLCHSRTRQAHGRGVHLVAYRGSLLKLGNLLGSLAGAHLHHGAYQCERGFVALARMMDAQQVGDGEHSVVAIGRQEVQGAPCGTRLAAKLAQGRHRSRLRNAHAGGHLSHAVNRTIPNDVLYVDVVAIEHLAIAVNINHSHKPRLLQPEVVEERGVLTEGVVGI